MIDHWVIDNKIETNSHTHERHGEGEINSVAILQCKRIIKTNTNLIGRSVPPVVALEVALARIAHRIAGAITLIVPTALIT